MRVDWTATALSDLDAIHAFIAADSPHYATAVVDRFTARCTQISAFPYSGEMVPEYQREDIREVLEYSYRMIYLVAQPVTWVLAVVHGAKPLPETPPTP
ncbi:type II toxin-antitoxin system RelE/ParE family toxin [Roseimaritima ulvae]|uniref:Plasmid stabilization system protein n=1 Tax=Roseimaritima ulvae TaxID=980254 RepID=A0A5B9R1J6_9BACT|nr:type II toxin-antitoxin system RelE/ParE family toxin [Roseimaritima ulvae]QEG40081.1 Plasmid stabilization system protein [Roseimaritima ulvae]